MSAIRVHHLSCGTMCPPASRLVNEHRRMVAHVLAIETRSDGIVLVDSGFGEREVAEPRRLPWGFRKIAGPRLLAAETARAQIEALGFSAADVRHIVVTHLDVDHAGGLCDFPGAVVHVHAAELEAARNPSTFKERRRYLGYQLEGIAFHAYSEAGDEIFGLGAVRSLERLDAEIALVPLFGHSRGHSGVAVNVGDSWLLHAGDAYFHYSELDDPPRGTVGLNLFQRLVQMDRRQRLANRIRLGEVARLHAGEVDVFCAHDPTELDRLAGVNPVPARVAGDGNAS